MANLLFRPTDLLDELSALRDLAEGFLDLTSAFRLEELTADIRGLQAQGGMHTLEIPELRPLKTRVSQGEFEPPNKKSSRGVYALITGIWEVKAEKHSLPNPSRPNKKPKPTMLIGFTGKASTVFDVKDATSGETVASWKMELGDANSPGCFFHTFASADHGFPVPRHPHMFATPMSAIGFVLGELFQGAWEETVSGASDAPNRWRSVQKKWFKALLGWQLDQVATTHLSPWSSLKIAKPGNTLFL